MGARKAQSARAWPKRAGQQRSVRRQKERTWPSPPATATFVRSGLQRASVPACGQQCPLRVAHSEPKLALLGELRELAAAPMLRLADLCPALLRLADVVPLCAVITQHPSLLELLGEPLQKRVEALVLAQLDMNRLRHLTSHPFGAPGLARNTVPAHFCILPHWQFMVHNLDKPRFSCPSAPNAQRTDSSPNPSSGQCVSRRRLGCTEPTQLSNDDLSTH